MYCRAFAGPVLGGYLYGKYEFEMTAVIIGSCSFFTVSLSTNQSISSFISGSTGPYKQTMDRRQTGKETTNSGTT